MSVLRTIEKDKVKFLMDYDYNNVLGRLKFVLGKDASFFADIRVRQNDVVWSTKDNQEYRCYVDANESEQDNIKKRVDEQITKLSSIISSDSLIGPHADKIVKYPSSQYVYYAVKDGDYDVILAGWGCDTTEPKEMKVIGELAFVDTVNNTDSVEDVDVLNNTEKKEEIPSEENIEEESARQEDCNMMEKDSVLAENKVTIETEESSEQIYTSEWLKENTNIHGWLSFFFFAIAIGGLVSAIYPIATFNAADYSGNMWLGAIDIILGIGMLAIAIYTIYAFNQRKPNAVFYGRLYVILVIVTNIIAAFSESDAGLGGIKQVYRGIIWGIIWFLYLMLSEQVKRIIPQSFRKVNKMDWGILCAIVVVPFLCFGIGMSGFSSEIDKRERLEFEMREIPLSDNERTDGRVIFSIPENFQCQSEEVEPIPGSKLMMFTIKNESIGTCNLCSDYDNDTSVKNFDEYWEGWENEDDKILAKTNVDRGSKTVNGHNCMYRIIRYNVNGVHIYWRFYILFDDLYGKCCVVSCYDCNISTKYVDEILESIRFK